MAGARQTAVILMLLFVVLSCSGKPKETPPENPVQVACEENSEAIVVVVRDRGPSHEPVGRMAFRRGFFISDSGCVLTAAHNLAATSPLTIGYISSDGHLHWTDVKILRQNAKLDLALLVPLQPIRPAKVLQLDLDNKPLSGQQIAVLTFLPRQGRRPTFVSAVLPGAVIALLGDGRFASNVVLNLGGSGSPAIDLASQRVIGVCVAASRIEDPHPFEKMPKSTSNGTTISVPTVYAPLNYGIYSPLYRAKKLLSDLP